MRLLLLHLSDLHIKGGGDPILSRSGHIARAVQDFDQGLDRCVIAISGDVAFSGKEEQLIEGWTFFRELEGLLRDCLIGTQNEIPIEFVAVPGNHDCDFERGDELRQAARQKILGERSGGEHNPLVNSCTKPQQPFFDSFLGELMGSRTSPAESDFPEDLYYEYNIYQNDEAYVRFRCCNTAWLSRLHEEQGELYFPADAVRQSSPQGREILAVTLFHHPYNWLEANSGREFRERVEAESDIILTGHEHDGSWSMHAGERGERNQYIEAGALQESEDPSSSSFNALVIETENQEQKLRRYIWDTDQYRPEYQTEEWEPLQVNQFHRHSDFTLKRDTRDFLEDLGTTIDHPRVGHLKLDDIFVYPDVQLAGSEGSDFPNFESSVHLRDRIREQNHILISGDDLSGKTSLSKNLFLDLFRDGLTPIYMRGRDEDLRNPEMDEFGYLEKLFCQQYGEEQLEKYRQLPREERAIILDDYHRLPKNLRGRSSFLECICQYSGHIIVTTDDILAEIEELTHSGSGSEESLFSFDHYRLQPFGNARREELIKKWVTLGRTIGPDKTEQIIRKREEFRQILDTIFGNDFIPAYPSYVLPVLYARESSIDVDPDVGTHGYFYGILIRSNLSQDRTHTEYDVLTGYLSYLAYSLFTEGELEISEEKFYEIHQSYQQKYDITRHGGEMLDELIEARVLNETAGIYKFKRRYFYYYFVANYISNRLREERIQEDVSYLCRNLHIEENSNILLFLAHQSKDALIIKELLNAASDLLPEENVATLDNDVEFFDDLREEVREIVYEEKDPEESRRELLERQDKIEQSSPVTRQDERVAGADDGGEIDEVADPTRQAAIALRTLNITGQVLKNFPGTLEKGPKLEVAKASYAIGLRTLSYILGVIRDTREEFVHGVVDRLSTTNMEADIIQIREEVRDLVASICQGVSFGMIRRIARAVGSPELSRTYERVLEHRDSPATQLINLSLELNYTEQYPTGNVIELAEELKSKPLPFSILRYMILRHFKLFPVDREDKQRICDAVDISYARVQIESAGSSQKMVTD